MITISKKHEHGIQYPGLTTYLLDKNDTLYCEYAVNTIENYTSITLIEDGPYTVNIALPMNEQNPQESLEKLERLLLLTQ